MGTFYRGEKWNKQGADSIQEIKREKQTSFEFHRMWNERKTSEAVAVCVIWVEHTAPKQLWAWRSQGTEATLQNNRHLANAIFYAEAPVLNKTLGVVLFFSSQHLAKNTLGCGYFDDRRRGSYLGKGNLRGFMISQEGSWFLENLACAPRWYYKKKLQINKNLIVLVYIFLLFSIILFQLGNVYKHYKIHVCFRWKAQKLSWFENSFSEKWR